LVKNGEYPGTPQPREILLAPDKSGKFAHLLEQLLGVDPATLEWPREFAIGSSPDSLAARFDPRNALLEIYGVRAEDLESSDLQVCLAAGQEAPDLCSRVLVYAQDSAAEAWEALGYKNEGAIPAYWRDGGVARLWARVWGARSAVPPDGCFAESDTRTVHIDPSLPTGWLCRPVLPDDAAAVSVLLRKVFATYPIPADPGSLRYGLATGEVHGRLVLDPDHELVAFAAWEFSATAGSVELTDCATAPACRGRGVMTYLVGRLEEDLADVFGDQACHSLAREDESGMQKVLARRGWRGAGRLSHHFRDGSGWVSACVWHGPPSHFKKPY